MIAIGLTVLYRRADAPQPGSRFRSSLTATLTDSPPALACQTVSLHWAPRADASAYRAYTAPGHAGPWSAIVASPPCGSVHTEGSTALVHAIPRTVAISGETTPRRVFYRVLALGANGPIDSTDAVPVEITLAAPVPHRP
jgi:hypothetical protein